MAILAIKLLIQHVLYFKLKLQDTFAVAAELAVHQSISGLTLCLCNVGVCFFFYLSSPTSNLKETVLDALIDPVLFLPQFVSIISPSQ